MEVPAQYSMATGKDIPRPAVTAVQDDTEDGRKSHNLHYAQRGGEILEDDGSEIQGFDAERMRDRTLLSAQEEKKLLRRIDWRIMPLCSVMFLLKNLDADNISNARIMNKGTPRNIMTELAMTADEYTLLTALYYVCLFEFN